MRDLFSAPEVNPFSAEPHDMLGEPALMLLVRQQVASGRRWEGERIVIEVPAATDPPPAVTAQVTVTPATALPLASRIVTVGGKNIVLPTSPVCVFPDVRTTWVAAPAVPVAVRAIGDPVRPVTVAVAAFAPAFTPRVQVLEACPSEFVLTESDPKLPPPPPPGTSKATETLAIAAPFWSVTFTMMGLASAAPAVPVWALPETRARVVATAGPPRNC